VFVVVIGNGGKCELEGCDDIESLVMEECHGVSFSTVKATTVSTYKHILNHDPITMKYSHPHMQLIILT